MGKTDPQVSTDVTPPVDVLQTLANAKLKLEEIQVIIKQKTEEAGKFSVPEKAIEALKVAKKYYDDNIQEAIALRKTAKDASPAWGFNTSLKNAKALEKETEAQYNELDKLIAVQEAKLPSITVIDDVIVSTEAIDAKNALLLIISKQEAIQATINEKIQEAAEEPNPNKAIVLLKEAQKDYTTKFEAEKLAREQSKKGRSNASKLLNSAKSELAASKAAEQKTTTLYESLAGLIVEQEKRIPGFKDLVKKANDTITDLKRQLDTKSGEYQTLLDMKEKEESLRKAAEALLNKQSETRYQEAVNTLSAIKPSATLEPHVKTLMKEIDKLKTSENVEAFIIALNATTTLLNNKKPTDQDFEDYKKIANNLPGKPSVALNVVGGLMVALAIAAALLAATGLGLILVVAGSAISVGAAAGGGVSFFSARRHGVSKAADEILHEQRSPAPASAPTA